MKELVQENMELKRSLLRYEVSTKLDYEKILQLKEEIKKLNIKELKIKIN